MMYLRSFFGLCNLFPRFVPSFASVAALLNKKLRKRDQKTFDRLSEDEITSLQTRKAKLEEPLVLGLPSLQGNYTVDTDTGDKGIGCILLQKQLDETNGQFGWWFHVLNNAERVYQAMHRQCLAEL